MNWFLKLSTILSLTLLTAYASANECQNNVVRVCAVTHSEGTGSRDTCRVLYDIRQLVYADGKLLDASNIAFRMCEEEALRLLEGPTCH